ncbi:heat shock protein 9/12-domain-containing protein [Mycena rosella]|uniref:Heat shock protein 9/12-domain-containing protein n=1 Tax=Mycena rosella TaxID=1033263 RepID=A0AAD7H0Y5_MYCRO|nr:heat shock protein 9/12-domain-containing protein [Mycena rosella]KAJ7709707.1 heat shock protein 9/12-domain-containing protein [Mycena rosella]
MADTGRQSLTDKAGAAIKPDSQKTTTEQAGDSIKGTADSVASTFQPNSDKSATQKAGDSVSSNSNHNDESLLTKAKDAVGLGSK